MEGRGRKTERSSDFLFPLLVSINVVKLKVRALKERRKRPPSAPVGVQLMGEASNVNCR